MDMKRQRVLITGGTRGIGLEIARAMGSRGAAVATCGRGERRPASLDAFGKQVRHFSCDLTAADDLREMVERVKRDFGAPTVLVNNAGVQFNHSWTETPADDRVARARREIELNLVAPVVLTALLLDDLMAAPESAVVNITSILALAPKTSGPVYSASKAGLRSFTRGLRLQLADASHVRVVEVVPPLVDTGMTAGRGHGKMDPAEVADAVVQGLETGREEIWIGKARVVRALWSVSPGTVGRMLRAG